MILFNSQDWQVFLLTLFIAIATLAAMHWLIIKRPSDLNAEQRLPRQLIMLALTIVAVISIVLSLPVSESSRNQILALIGVLLSGVIAFSSTTIVSNLMAGVVLRLNKPFRTGDYITCEGFIGRVTEKGLLDTEIQTEQRTLVHIANNYLINHPVDVVRSSGTFISAEVSLGYDVHHATIAKLLEKAAVQAGLKDTFVHVIALGDFTVSYKVSGIVGIKSILTSRSKLHVCILDELHNNDVEILSPHFVAQRPTAPEHKYIPTARIQKPNKHVTKEHIAFDKAEEAEKVELRLLALHSEIEEIKSVLAGDKDGDKKHLKPKLASLQEEMSALKSLEPKSD